MAYEYTQIDRFLAERGIPVVGPRSGQGKRSCSSGSFHCYGLGRDYGSLDYGHTVLARMCELLEPHAVGDGPIRELFYRHPDGRGWFYDEGRKIRPSAALDAQHEDHVHTAKAAGATLPSAPPPTPEDDIMVLLTYGNDTLIAAGGLVVPVRTATARNRYLKAGAVEVALPAKDFAEWRRKAFGS